ncbi:MAG: hypothetical protein ACLF0P_06165 [Thermoanaerobaculia bacterium]
MWKTVSTLTILFVLLAAPAADAAPPEPDDPAPVSFLVVAPDRGFLGNEEVRDAFAPFAERHAARLVFATDERTREALAAALGELTGSGEGGASGHTEEGGRPAGPGTAGSREVVVLPLFVAPSSPRLALVRALLEDLRPPGIDVRWGRPYGGSYLAVEALADRLRQAPAAAPTEEEHGHGGERGHGDAHADKGDHGHGEAHADGGGHGDGTTGRTLVVVGSGARDEASREALRADWLRLARWAANGLDVSSVRVAIAPDGSLEDPDRYETLQERFEGELAEAAGDGALVVPFHLAWKLDGMMSLDAALPRMLPEGAELAAAGVTPDPAVGLWMEREANRHLTRTVADLGVVALAHGSDYHWNQTMRRALEPLDGRYLVVPTFSMADRNLTERAIRTLDEDGARAAVVVRIFGLSSSFRGGVERMLGLDVEAPDGALAEPPAAGAADHGHGGHGHGGPPPPRIRTALVTTTVGGLENHPLFARALYERALEISEEPAREILILAAHGRGEDEANDHWKGVLSSLAAQIRELSENRFRAVETVTWREDWPGKREPEIERARRLVADAAADGGRALVVPARTNAEGPARELLEGLDFRVGTGFAPHALFPEWIHAMVLEGLDRLALTDEARGALRAALEDGRSDGSRRASAGPTRGTPRGSGAPEEP